jgi:hypothetical protein
MRFHDKRGAPPLPKRARMRRAPPPPGHVYVCPPLPHVHLPCTTVCVRLSPTNPGTQLAAARGSSACSTTPHAPYNTSGALVGTLHADHVQTMRSPCRPSRLRAHQHAPPSATRKAPWRVQPGSSHIAPHATSTATHLACVPRMPAAAGGAATRTRHGPRPACAAALS